MDDMTLLLNRVTPAAAPAADLLPPVYAELRRLAAHKMAAEAAGHTLQPTALVHEAWLRVGGADQVWQNRAHFFGAAAEAMRRILVEHARRRRAVRHGGGMERVGVDQAEVAAPAEDADQQILDIHEALDALAVDHAQKAELVKLRYFVGLTNEEAAEALGISAPTATRYWAFARVWLFRRIERSRGGREETRGT
jgi:RNA polymerase sigma factor (TIGR02999 family)